MSECEEEYEKYCEEEYEKYCEEEYEKYCKEKEAAERLDNSEIKGGGK